MNEQKLKLSAVVASMMFFGACTISQAVDTFFIAGCIGFALAIIGWIFKKKITELIKKSIKGKTKFFLIIFLAFLILEEKGFAQTVDQIDFSPAVGTFKKILCDFSKITAGACGFYGLTRVGWLCVNEERSTGTSFVYAVVGFILAIIAVGLLQFNMY
ncbi:MAG: hypothetical protein KAW12_26205 [Candidatus Aminicenantes bacterium]|nr:hypothetical protein [Candidatus Aminicenantes bacterium]